MNIKKKLLSAVLSLALALQVSAIALPAYADDTADANIETDNLAYKLEAIRSETNMVGTDTSFEDSQTLSSAWRINTEKPVTASISSNQSFTGDYSLLVNGASAAGADMYKVITGYRPNATYITSMMVLGTNGNAALQPSYAEIYVNKFGKRIGSYPTGVATILGGNQFLPRELSTAPLSTATEQTKAEKSDWKQAWITFKTANSVTQYTEIGPDIWFGYPGLEYYIDDYYVGELMVADVKTADISEIAMPAPGGAAETVELSASALNQLGTTDGLEDTEFEWSLTAGEVEGISLDGNILTVTDEAQGGNLSLTVECYPNFLGAEDQTSDITRYRTKEVIVTIKELTEAEKRAAFLKQTNMVGSNADFEESQSLDGWAASGTISASVSNKQSYSGDYSLLINGKGANNAYYYKAVNGYRPNATYILSAMVLGTKNNAAAEPSGLADQWINKFSANTATPTAGVSTNISNNQLLPRELSSAPLSTDDPQEKMDASEWKQLWRVFETKNNVTSSTVIGPQVYVGYKDVEYYSDNYYVGELVVYNVENKTAKKSVEIPTGTEKAELELKAEAYNQIGTQDGLEGSTFTWEIDDENVYGVSIEDGKLIVTNDANVRTLNLKVTCVPAFTGADTQTDAQKARRTINVPIELTAAPGASEAPQAKEIKLTGSVALNETLTLSYKYWQLFNVAEGDTEITWYRSENADGPWEAFNKGNLTYKLEEEGEDELFYRAEVKPVSEDEIEGTVAKTATLCKPVAPVASNVKVKGVQAIDEEWEVVSYDYYDKNDDAKDEPIYQWYVSETKNIEDGIAIDGATEKKYKITEAEAGKYVYVGVKAVAKVEPKVAEKFAYSEPRLTSDVPKVSGVKIKKDSSNLVKVEYNYSHSLSIAEGETVIEWYNGNELIGKGTSLNVSSLKGEEIEVRVTPMAEKKPYAGATVTADYEVSFGSSSVGGSPVSGGGGGGGTVVKPAAKPEIQNVPTWAKTEIDYVLKNNIMEVAAENDFGGSNKINRGEFMMAMLKAAGISPSDYRGSFADVTSLDKFSGYLQSAFDQGVISAADNFYPARELTRDEMCKIIVTSIEAMTKKEISKSAITHFTDYSNIQAWAIDYISQAVATGIIVGNADGSVNPKGNVTRAEAAVVAKRIVEYVKAEGGLK